MTRCSTYVHVESGDTVRTWQRNETTAANLGAGGTIFFEDPIDMLRWFADGASRALDLLLPAIRCALFGVR